MTCWAIFHQSCTADEGTSVSKRPVLATFHAMLMTIIAPRNLSLLNGNVAMGLHVYLITLNLVRKELG